jgi:DNA-directed RNA polymerase specialized sigma24 family protein
MERANLNSYYAANTGLIHTVAGKGYRRLMAIGASVDYEDLVQDLSEVFIKAYDLFDETRGAKFSTYFVTAANNKINALAREVEVERIGVKTTRCRLDEVDEETGKSKWSSRQERIHAGTTSVEEMNERMGEDGASILETIASSAASPEQIVEAASTLENMLSRMSPLASFMVEAALDPPAFMEREFEAAQAHAEYARGIGVPRRSGTELDIGFVAGFLNKTMGIPVRRIRDAKEEIINATEAF